jgi:hypothetical protein
MTAQFFPACFSVAINGLANNSVNFSDLNTNRILLCNAKTWVNNSTGENENVYEIWYQEYQTLEYTTYLFPRTVGQGVGQFLAIVQAWAPTNNLTQYSGWTELNRRPVGTGRVDVGGSAAVARDLLLNDDYVARRTYVVNALSTDIYLTVGQTLDYQVFRFSGNLTKAIPYYYGYTWNG